MGVISGEYHTAESLLGFLQQPDWDVPIPSASIVSLRDITGHGAAERPVSPFAPFPETRGREGSEGGCKLCITTN